MHGLSSHRLRSIVLVGLAASILPMSEFYSGKARAESKAADHGVDSKHKNAAVESKADNHPDTKGDQKVDEPGKDTGAREERSAEGDKKSIVPGKYAGKYKNGGSDPLALFLTEHSTHPETKDFSFDRFFTVMEKNGIDKAHIDPFREQVAAKAQGAAGRARMTLRNRLDAVVRKEGHVVDHDGHKHDMKLEPRANARSAKEPVAA